MTWKLTIVPKEEVRTIWPTVAPMLARVVPLTRGRTTMQKLFETCTGDKGLLWAAYDDADGRIAAAFVTRVVEYPGRKVLVVDCAAGDGMRKWLDTVVSTFRKFAAASGLDGVEMFGRKGWRRVLGACGWREAFVLMEIDASE